MSSLVVVRIVRSLTLSCFLFGFMVLPRGLRQHGPFCTLPVVQEVARLERKMGQEARKKRRIAVRV